MRRADMERIHKKAAKACGVLALALASGRADREEMQRAAVLMQEASQEFNRAVAEEKRSI